MIVTWKIVWSEFCLYNTPLSNVQDKKGSNISLVMVQNAFLTSLLGVVLR